MNIKTPDNENYAATIIKVVSTKQLDNLDNLVGVPTFGLQALIPKAFQVGSLAVLLPAGTQLSDNMAKNNNLYRNSTLNSDKSLTGYLEENRRVRAIRLKQNSSSALILSLDSLAWTGVDVSELKEGNTFDSLNGEEICRKYEVKREAKNNINTVVKKQSRIDERFFPEHITTLNYWRNKNLIKGNDSIVILQKLHGTSVRIGKPPVKRKLSIVDKALDKLNIKIQKTERAIIGGSRKVIKDTENEASLHFYNVDIWTAEALKLKDIVPDGFMIYGEIVGFTPDGTEIQKNYTYNEVIGNSSMYIYRVSVINPNGFEVDLSWDAVKEFCDSYNLKYTPELWRGKHRNVNVDSYMDIRYNDSGFKQAIPLSNGDTVDEGVIIRKESIIPKLFKAKAPKFLEHESAMLDDNILDIEETQK